MAHTGSELRGKDPVPGGIKLAGLQDAWNRDYARKGRMWARGQEGIPRFSQGTRVLEAGCGDGKTLRTLIRERPGAQPDEAPEIVAFDFSREAVRLSNASLSPASGISLLTADAACLPFSTGSFDAVLLVHLLGHAPSDLRNQIAREAARVTRRGGRIYVRVFSTGDFRAGQGMVAEPGTYRRETGILTHYFTADEVGQLFPALHTVRLSTIGWTMRIRGKDLRREEIHAEFVKPE